jgi:hypothetical protein
MYEEGENNNANSQNENMANMANDNYEDEQWI